MMMTGSKVHCVSDTIHQPVLQRSIIQRTAGGGVDNATLFGDSRLVGLLKEIPADAASDCCSLYSPPFRLSRDPVITKVV